eukprot:gnl/MRDRNA2_/MRDRNA2_93498_c0_seq1.p1 gnl/MRDRNA2_/MRDRNA2_93498_c0~~gnl/MRDRNA2_/MRDRNA2_93498_c0_seq1.p1  ORF type:complete len:417 (-),score=141.07 gnl/MRDRNA2_/MRDRNA2_93498_c0_seq1:235-1485(-)
MWGKASKERDLLQTAKDAKEAEVEQLKKDLEEEKEKNMKLEMRLQAWIAEHNTKSEHRDALIGELATESKKTQSKDAEITQLKATKLILEEELYMLRPVKSELDRTRNDLQNSQKGFDDLQELFKANKAQIEKARQDQEAAQELPVVKAELQLANTEIARLRDDNTALKAELEAGKQDKQSMIEERKMHARVEARLQDSLKTSEDMAASCKMVQQELNLLKLEHKDVKEKHDHMAGNWEVKENELKGHRITISDLTKTNTELVKVRELLETQTKSLQSNLQAAKLLQKAEQTSAKDLLEQLTELKSAYEQAALDRDAARAHLKTAQEEKSLALQSIGNLRGALSNVAPLFEPMDMPMKGNTPGYQQFTMPQKPSLTAAQMLQPQLPGQLQDAGSDLYALRMMTEERVVGFPKDQRL